MTASQLIVAHATKLVLLIALVGIAATRRYRLCWSFVGYLAAALIANCLFSFWPERFLVTSFWMLQQIVCDCLKVGIAVELMIRVFQAFPRAKVTARRMLITLLSLTALALVGVPPALDYSVFALQWEPRVLTGTLWLMIGLAVVVAWYRIPIDRFHKAILLGLVPYLLVFTTVLHLVHRHGWARAESLQGVEPMAYLFIVAFWTWSAWRPSEVPETPPAVLALMDGSLSRPAIRPKGPLSAAASRSATAATSAPA